MNMPEAPSEKERVATAVHLLEAHLPDIRLEVLGTGFETVVVTDRRHLYKVFDKNLINYQRLLDDLKERFKEPRRFPGIVDHLVLDGFSVLKVEHKPSTPYEGGRIDEMVEFLVECVSLGIVCWDVKPLNFRVFEDGLKFIDYGWDIKPYNYKDLIFMVQRAFLATRFHNHPEFLALTRRARRDLDTPFQDEFLDFFDLVYRRMVERGIPGPDTQELRLHSEEDLYLGLIEEVRERWNGVGCRVRTGNREGLPRRLVSEPGVIIDDAGPRGDGQRVVIVDGTIDPLDRSSRERLSSLRDEVRDDGRAYLIVKNPFFYSNVSHPLSRIRSNLLASGLEVVEFREAPYHNHPANGPASDHMVVEVRPSRRRVERVSLLIKTCAQDAQFIEPQIRHIVRQCESPTPFLEKLVVVDPRDGGFLRQYADPDSGHVARILDLLRDEGVIDDYLVSTGDPGEVRSINREWFGIDVASTHTVQGVPVTPQLFGFERCRGDYILQMDLDVIIGRRDRQHDFVADMIRDLKGDPGTFSVSMNIAHHPDSSAYLYTSPGGGQYVPEVRFCMLDKERLFSKRPFPNEVVDGMLKLSWYRSVERFQRENGYVSLRGGDPRSFYIHPPNEYKKNVDDLMHVVQRVELGYIPALQFDRFDLCGDASDWAIPRRRENYVFIICGRNVPPSKFQRCWNSILRQTREDWGAIIVDDASENGLGEYLELQTAALRDRVTFIRNVTRRGVLRNVHLAITRYCINPFSVMVILDMDDMLLSDDVLRLLNVEYLKGADMTVGTTFKLGSGVMRFVPDFNDTRNSRCGDVWMHLRTFRRYLFTEIAEEDFKRDGEWIDRFTELAYTVPIAEMARHPVHIRHPIYLWEPGHPRDEEHYRSTNEAKRFIAEKRGYNPPTKKHLPRVRPFGEMLDGMEGEDRWLMILRHAEKVNGVGEEVDSGLSERGVEESILLGETLPSKIDVILSSPSVRAVQTGEHIRAMNNPDSNVEVVPALRSIDINERNEWRKEGIGYDWKLILKRWSRGELEQRVAGSLDSFYRRMLETLMDTFGSKGAERAMVVTHDHVLYGLSVFLFKEYPVKVGYLHGIATTADEVRDVLEGKVRDQ